MNAVTFRPVRRVIDSPGATSSVRLIPSGVSSKAQASTSAMGKPRKTRVTNTFITHAGASKVGKQNRRRLNQQPRDDRVGDRHLVNIAPLQLGEEVVRFIHDNYFDSFRR